MDRYECEYCLDLVKTGLLLSKHQEKNKDCLFYRHVQFICKKCNFSTIGIKNINNHVSSEICCVKNDDINEYIIDDNSIETYDKDSDLVDKLKQCLKIEKIKNDIYRMIIEKNIPIKLDNILINNETGLHIFEKNLNDIGIHIHKNEKEELSIITNLQCTAPNDNNPPSPCNSVDSEDKNNKTNFRSYKILKPKDIDLWKEKSKEELDLKIQEIYITEFSIRKTFGNLDQSKNIFKTEFENLKTARIYSKPLDIIKKTRINLIGTLSYNEYIILLNDHIKAISTIMKDKGHNDKKVTTIIFNSLTSLDLRLSFYGNYFDVAMDIEEVSKFRTCLELSTKSPAYYTFFDANEVIKRFFNYGSVLMDIKTCIEIYLINKYDLNNIVYIPLNQSTDDDPYSFYILENINKDKRCWKMDCRLVEISDTIITSLRPYLISIFRKIYQDIFHDNDYRDDYSTKTEITGNDFEQLLHNIFVLSDSFGFYSMMKKIIKEKATYMPTENDKVNMISDDLILRKRFQNKKDHIDKAGIVRLLFDNITTEQTVDFYRSKISPL